MPPVTSLSERFPYRFVLLLAIIILLLGAARSLEYQSRGHYHEGVKSKPIGGQAIELLGASAVQATPDSGLPPRLSVHFYLERSEQIHVTVRERHPQTHYWLDRVDGAWRSGSRNAFSWSSATVLRRLGLRMENLLVLVRLGRPTPGRRERVAPAFLQDEVQPGPVSIGAYRLTFRARGESMVQHRVYPPRASEPVSVGAPRRRTAWLPFDLSWAPRESPEGTYRVVVEGYFLTDNSRFTQEVEFFHAASWPR